MTDQFTSLNASALKDIIVNIDLSLAVFARHSNRLTASELQIKKMLEALRTRLLDKLQNHPELEG